MPSSAAEFENIDVTALQALIDRGVRVIDVRTPNEWRQTGVIAGSEQIMAFLPDGRFNPEFSVQFQAVAKPDDEVAIICWTGARSQAVSDALSRQAGYSRVYNVEGGMMRWLDEGRPVDPCTDC